MTNYYYTGSTASFTISSTGAIGSSIFYSSPTVASGALLTSSGSNGTSWSTNLTKGLHVESDAEFEGDIKWKGRSLGKLLETIEDRLAILHDPDPAKLEKYAALKKAYDHYKILEKLIGEE